MKILFLARRFYPEIGGVEKHVEEISKLLVRQGNQVLVLCEEADNRTLASSRNYHLSASSDSPYIDLKQPVKSIQSVIFEGEKIVIARLNFGKNDWFKKFRIWAQIIKNYSLFLSADVIHCHDVFFWYLPLRFLLPHKKVYITFHGYETKFPPTLSAIMIRKLSEWFTDGNICVGKYIEKWYGTSADFITYGGVERVKIMMTKSLSKKDRMNILLLGRLEKDNGAEIYLKTLEILNKKKKVNFTALGDGTYSKRFQRFGTILGFEKEIMSRIMKADIVFASSYLSILESLVLGKKVFCVYQNDLKKDYLVVSPFKKYVGIASSADELIAQMKQREKQSIVGAQKWASEQTWQKVLDIYLKLWKK